jgi:DNA-binding MltR family transcriptional regulator
MAKGKQGDARVVRPKPPDKEQQRLMKLAKALWKETERGCVLVAASMLDELLRKLLEEFLVDCTATAQLLSSEKGGGRLGEFFARTNVAYALGLITKSEMQRLLAVGEMRNQLAHRWEVATFADIADIDGRLQVITGRPVDGYTSARKHFMDGIANLIFLLLNRINEIAPERRVRRAEPVVEYL